MISETRFNDFLDRIYEAAARPELWREVLNEMAVVTESAGVQITRHGMQGATLHATSKGLDEVLRAYFHEGWNRNNPREIKGRLRGIAANEVVTDRDLFAPEELDGDPWQTEFLDRFGLKWFLSLGLREVLEPEPFFLSVERYKASSPFTDDEVALFRAATPHLRRAFRLSTIVGSAAQSGMMDALTALKQAAILLDETGLVVRMNSAADALIGNGVTVTRGRLRARSPAADPSLQVLLEDVCRPGRANLPPAVGTIALPRRGDRPLIVQAAPLVNTARDIFQRARALVALNPLETLAEPNGMVLRQAFNLTAAEVRVAHQMATGAGLTAAATTLGVSASTARSHLKSVFRKTATHSQSELAVLLSQIGPGLALD
jgi:DNA-binding CsgD family transcriptional regulator